MTGIYKNHKKNVKWVLRACMFTAVFAVLFFFARQEAYSLDDDFYKKLTESHKAQTGVHIDDENILRNDRDEYSGSGTFVAGDLNLRRYVPWHEYNQLPRLDSPAPLLISGDYPQLDGATAGYPLYAAVANELYAVEDKKELGLYMKCSRTEEAYNRLIRGETDMIFVLQPSDEQLQAAKAAHTELHFTPVAKDAFVFFVNSRNPVSGLSIDQIRDIYRKKITNWREVGGNDRKILPFQRPNNSGSQTAMIKEVMKGESLPQALHELRLTMKAVFLDVAEYRDYEEAIGYSFRFFTEEMMRDVLRQADHYRQPFEISPEFGEEYRSLMQDNHDAMQEKLDELKPVKLLAIDGAAPSAENIRNGTYPFTVDWFAVTAGTSNPRVRDMLAWILSPQCQELFEKAGYVGAAAKQPTVTVP